MFECEDNLIDNGDFSMYTFDPNLLCTQNFNNTLVPRWFRTSGSPDLSLIDEADPFLLGCNCPEKPNHVTLAIRPSGGYVESIHSATPTFADPSIFYRLNFDCNASNVPFNVILVNSLTPTPVLWSNYPVYLNEQVVFDEIINGNDSSLDCETPFQNHIVEFRADIDYSLIAFTPDLEFTETAPYEMDNVILTCHSRYLNGIAVQELDNLCEFTFRPAISNALGNVTYDWDLGDGNTSDLPIINHTYAKPGTYVVSLTIVDQYGCCTTVTTTVTCMEDDLCLSFLCWEDFTIHRCVNSVTLELPDGTETTIPFSILNNAPNICNDPFFQNPIPDEIRVAGGYCEIASQIIFAIEQLGYNVDFYQEDPRGLIECMKGPYAIPGFFFDSEVKVIQVNGNDNCDGTSDPGVEFNEDC